MFRSYFKIAVRNLFKRKDYSILNILGLAVGMASCLLIFQYVSFEKGYDDFPKANDIVRLRLDSYQDGKLEWQSAAVYPAFGPTMKRDFAEVDNYCRLAATEMLLSNDERNVRFNESKGYYADPSFLSMFNIDIVKGNSRTALDGLNKIMLSKALAKKYFGHDDPLGNTLTFRAPYSTKIFEVTGIFNPPVHSHLIINYLISYPTIGSFRRDFGDRSRPEETSWGWYQFYTYLLLKPGTDIKRLESKFPAFCDLHINSLDWKKQSNTRNEVYLIPVKDIHLHSNYMQEAEPGGNPQAVSFLFLVAIFIVIIAWINYINLATARSLERAKEVGVRKVIGATRMAITLQFFLESILINLLAFSLSIIIVYTVAPGFRNLTGTNMQTGFYLPVDYWLLIAGILLGGTALSGLYPALVLSRFKPVAVLKGLFKNSSGGLALRKGLIIVQFAISVILIAATIIVYRQVSFMRSQPLGANVQQTLVLEGAHSIKDTAYQNAFQPFKNSILQLPGVKNMTVSTSVMGKENFWANGVTRLEGDRSSTVTIDYLGIDYDFIPFYEMKMVAGRNFSRDFPSDSSGTVLNETAVRMLGFGSPREAINHKIGAENGTTIIGVVKDYHTESLHKSIDPQLMILRLNARNVYSVKIQSGNMSSVIAAIKAKWDSWFPDDPFSYYFLDEVFDKQYKTDQQFGSLFTFFAAIAIIIACMGLLGLAAYNVLQRTKEIGIRKVFGASVQNIVFLLSKDFIQLILIAFVLAIPVAWWSMHNWLQQFAYRISISWWIFLLSGLLVVIIALVTISFQAIKAAIANPVKSLRTE